jgi:hypothetical protein
MKLPCEDCICLPVCKGKNFYQLKRDCSIFRNFLFEINKTPINSAERNHWKKKNYWRKKMALKKFFNPQNDSQIDGWNIRYEFIY